MSKCVHVVYIGDFQPDMWRVTYPLIQRYAAKIGAHVNVITQRKYPEWKILYEKMQVHEDGKGYAHNFLVDADVLIHPDFPDFSTICRPYHVGFNDNFHASEFFDVDNNIYFKRDGRNVGIATNAVITCRYTHDLWRPLPYDLEEAKTFLLHDKSHIDEFALSENLARYGLLYNGITWEDWQRFYLVHLGTGDVKSLYQQIDQTLQTWRHHGAQV